jgi:hypothetical protein
MKIRIIQIGIVIVVISAIALYLQASKSQSVDNNAVSSVPAKGVPPAPNAKLAALASSPEAQELRKRMAFESGTRRFFRDAQKLSPAMRSERAQKITEEIDAREQRGEFSAGEVVMLRVALIQATVTDEAERMRQAKAVMDRYRAIADEKQAQYIAQQQQDPKFQDYKALESSIVAEVMAMRRFPGQMSRDEYLRVRLQQAREVAYGP